MSSSQAQVGRSTRLAGNGPEERTCWFYSLDSASTDSCIPPTASLHEEPFKQELPLPTWRSVKGTPRSLLSVTGMLKVRHRPTHKDGVTVCNTQGVRQLLGTYKPLGWLI